MTDACSLRSSCCSEGGSRKTCPSERPTWFTCVIGALNGLTFRRPDPSTSYRPLTSAVCRGTGSGWPCHRLPPNSGGPAVPLGQILLAALSCLAVTPQGCRGVLLPWCGIGEADTGPGPPRAGRVACDRSPDCGNVLTARSRKNKVE